MITEDISQIPQSKDSLPQSSQYLVIYGRLASWRLVLEIIIIFLKYEPAFLPLISCCSFIAWDKKIYIYIFNSSAILRTIEIKKTNLESNN